MAKPDRLLQQDILTHLCSLVPISTLQQSGGPRYEKAYCLPKWTRLPVQNTVALRNNQVIHLAELQHWSLLKMDPCSDKAARNWGLVGCLWVVGFHSPLNISEKHRGWFTKGVCSLLAHREPSLGIENRFPSELGRGEHPMSNTILQVRSTKHIGYFCVFQFPLKIE